MPHLVSECFENLKNHDDTWPKIDNKFLEEETTTIVLQINGKKKTLIKCENDIDEKNLIKLINQNSEFSKFVENKNIFKTIFVKNKIINFIIK